MDPLTAKLIAQAAVKVVTDEQARRRLLLLIFAPILCVLLILTAFFYIITHPLAALGEFFQGDAMTQVSQMQNDYGMYQGLSSTDSGYIESNGKTFQGVTFTDGATTVVYYNQMDSRWADKPYGTDTIGGYACGPTSMAIVVSTLTTTTMDPVQMANWAYEHGYWCKGSGSYHSLIPGTAQAFGLNVEGCQPNAPQKIVDALSSGDLVVALMAKGHFTSSGHFIVLRGVTKDGEILVADPASDNRSNQEWDLSIILNEASKSASSGGPFWIISKKAEADSE
jgi:hypothetical protein